MKNMYYIAILPNDKICNEIRGFKEELEKDYGISWALRSPAHITLFPPFHLEEDSLNAVINRLRGFNYCNFPIELDSFDKFDAKVIYLKVKDHHHFIKVKDRLEWELSEFNIKSRTHEFHPHMTIAHKDLDERLFEKLWKRFRGEPYYRKFKDWSIKVFEYSPDGWMPII